MVALRNVTGGMSRQHTTRFSSAIPQLSPRASNPPGLRSPRTSENPYPRLSHATLGLRFYSADLGRWLNRDPAETEGDLALYVWVRNNPVSSYDALGLSTEPSWPREMRACAMAPGQAPRPWLNEDRWFDEKIPGDGDKCCCSQPAEIILTRADEPAMYRTIWTALGPVANIPYATLRLRVNIEKSGCYQKLQYVWKTCWRRDWAGNITGGIIPGSWMKQSVDLQAQAYPGQTTALNTWFIAKWLSCNADGYLETKRDSVGKYY